MKISAKAGSQILEIEVRRENGVYVVDVDGVRHDVDAHKLEGDFYSILTGGRSYEVSVEAVDGAYHVRHGAAELTVSLSDPGRQARDAQRAAAGPEEVCTMMPGKVVRLLVAEGDTVHEGQGVAVVEAMKMENEITAGKAGRVSRIDVEPQQAVEGGALLLVIE
jgi:biotin carboxyl carrier protein